MFEVKLSELKEIFHLEKEAMEFVAKAFSVDEGDKELIDEYWAKHHEKQEEKKAKINALPNKYVQSVVKKALDLPVGEFTRFVKICELCMLKVDYEN